MGSLIKECNCVEYRRVANNLLDKSENLKRSLSLAMRLLAAGKKNAAL